MSLAFPFPTALLVKRRLVRLKGGNTIPAEIQW